MTLTEAWERLRAVRSLRFSATSNDQVSGWEGAGTGTVKVTVTGNSTITFTENGTWIRDSGQQLDFNNIYRWGFDWDAQTIRLEHLRRRPDSPVFLLELEPTDGTTFESVSPHRCGADLYTATVKFKDDRLCLRWHVKGPKKDAEVCCMYEVNVDQ